jgi:hypothetical protein
MYLPTMLVPFNHAIASQLQPLFSSFFGFKKKLIDDEL